MLIIILLSAEWIGVMNRFKDERVDSVAVTPLKVYYLAEKGKKRSLAVLLYVCFYHPLLSGIRLYELGKIPRKWIVKSLIPFWNLKYLRELYF